MAKEPQDQVLGENDHVRVVSRSEFSNYQAKEVSLYKAMPDQRGAFMMDLVRTWGMVGGKRGNDTSEGRPTLELLSEEEVVNRAMKMTDLTFQVIAGRGWQVALDRTPPPEEEGQ